MDRPRFLRPLRKCWLYAAHPLASGTQFGLNGAFDRFVRLPFSLSEIELVTAVAGLARAWAALSDPAADRVLVQSSKRQVR